MNLCKALDQGYKRAVAIWHRRAGKDKTLINIMVKEAFKRVGSYFYFLPTYKQGRMIIWNGMDKDGFPFLGHVPEEIRRSTNGQEMKIELINGSIIQVVGTDQIDRVVGTNPIGAVFSEYSLQKKEAWEFIRPILAENGGWAIFNYTPRGLNHGYDLYKTGLKSKDWFCEVLGANQTKNPDKSPVITPELIQKERDEGMSEAMIQQEFYCDFTASSDDVLIPLELIQKSAGKVIPIVQYYKAPKIIGVDVARFGDDRSVIIFRQGLAVYGLRVYQGLDNMQIADILASLINEKEPDAVFIDGGRGEGVIDRLKQLNYDVTEVQFGGNATEPSRYINKRAEMWCKCRDWLKSGGAIPDDLDLRTDLSIPTYSFDARDRIKLLAKDKMKAEFGFSPDLADALVLTFAAPVRTKEDQYDRRNSGYVKSEYDLFDEGSRQPRKMVQNKYDMFRESA